MSNMVRLAVIGAGARGTRYAEYALAHPELARIVAVADPDDFHRCRLSELHHIPSANQFRSWQDFVRMPKCADAVLICTQDALHEAPAIACAEAGYDILLEKPMAPTAEACRRIVAAVQRTGVMFAVCHVLRYNRYTRIMKQLLDFGRIGDIVNIQHLEPVGYWHQAHAFVRGKWRCEAESSSMLLAKCCHDLDWLRYIVARPCVKVQSFGTLRHFRALEQPSGAADRCVNCPAAVESRCPYSALKIYFRDRFDQGNKVWPVDVLTEQVTAENLMDALKNGPYGRCVYACDNDVVDNQVVNLQFADGATASLTMTAFNRHNGRRTRIFGTRGEIDTDSEKIRIFDFSSDTEEILDTRTVNDGGILSGHGGGDLGLMEAFVRALAERDSKYILSGTEESLESHLMVFAAEASRHTDTVQPVGK